MDWQLQAEPEPPIIRPPEPCVHADLVWTSLDSAYCPECGQEMCAEVSTFLRELVTIRDSHRTA